MSEYPIGGCLPDPPDHRDVPLGAVLAAEPLPPSASVWDDRVAIRDQGSTSSCVGQAVATGLRLAYLRRGQPCPTLSARALYRLALGPSRDVVDGGTWIRACVAAARRVGAPGEVAHPGVQRILEPVSLGAAFDGADRWGVRRYYRIPSGDLTGVRRALAAGLPVVGGWQVGAAFTAYAGRGLVQPEQRTRGGHALCLVGYAEQDGDAFFAGVNSWGTAWGARGMFHASDSWVAQGGDLWALDVRQP